MSKYDVYFVEGCEDRELYQKMIGIAMPFCDTMSLVYIKNKQNDKSPDSTKAIKKVFLRINCFICEDRDVSLC